MLIRLGTRGSRLALAQADAVASALRAAHEGLVVEVVVVQTTGDKILDSPLSRIGGKGVFTKEIEERLLAGEIDVAVHSLKDLPTIQPEGLALGAITAREDPADALICPGYGSIAELPAGARVGTSSLRRRAQLAALRPDVEVAELRGNVPTRLDRVARGEYDAIVLAAAGIERLGLRPAGCRPLDCAEFLPAPGQGALGLQIRLGDTRVAGLLAVLNDAAAAACCTAERALLQYLGGGCQLPLGALATIESGSLVLRGRALAADGSASLNDEERGAPAEAEAVGARLAARLLARGAGHLLGTLAGGAGFDEAVARAAAMDQLPLGGRVVVVTRAEDADGPLSNALRALGAHPACLPLVGYGPPQDEGPLREACARIEEFDWLVLTSARAVDAVALYIQGARLEPGVPRVACVGDATAAAARRAGLTVDLVPESGHDAEALSAALIAEGVAGARVLYPRSSAAASGLADALRAAGADVADPIAYEATKTALRTGANAALLDALRQAPPDAITFASPSAVDAFAALLAEDSTLGALATKPRHCSIGPSTTAAMHRHGLPVAAEAEDRSFEGLARAVQLALTAV